MRGLKKFKRLAKQDLLFSSRTSEPLYWRTHAVARRNQYTDFMEAVERGGVDEAYKEAIRTYTQLPRLDREAETENPEIAGREQAFHLFFDLLGIDRKTTAHLRSKRKRPLRKQPDAGAPTQTGRPLAKNKTNNTEVHIAQKSS